MLVKVKSPELVQVFRSILSRLPSRRRRQFWILFVCMLVSAGIETITLASIALFASAVANPDEVLQSKNIVSAYKFLHFDFLRYKEGLIVFLSILAVALVVLKNGVISVVTYLNIRFGCVVDAFFGERLLSGFMYLPYEWHLNRNSADLVLAVGWRFYLGTFFINTMLQVLCHFFVILFMFITLIAVDPVISIIAIFVLGAAGVFIHKSIAQVLHRVGKRQMNYAGSLNREVTKTIHGVKDVKVFGKESSFVRNYSRDVFFFARESSLLQFFIRLPAWLLETFGFVLIAVSICIMMFGKQASSAHVIGMMALLVVAAWRVLPGINRVLSGLATMKGSLEYVHKVMKYLKEIELYQNENLAAMAAQYDDIAAFENELRFEHLSFSYDNCQDYAVKDISFTVRKGQSVGIIGKSGAGKSTLVDILIGLLSPSGGRITIDEKVLSLSLQRSWTNKIGYVSQSPYIYDGTLAGNVAFGLEEKQIDREKVLESCQMAAIGFIENLTAGIDTQIGERGVRLSGGELQRVAIARALYHKPEVMVFDEATSSLDSQNEKAIQKTIYSLKGKITLIIVTHRLTTVEGCDVLICLNKGKIAKIGPPDIVLPWYADNLE